MDLAIITFFLIFYIEEVFNNKHQTVVLEAKSVGSSRSARNAVALVIPGVTRPQLTHSEEVKLLHNV